MSKTATPTTPPAVSLGHAAALLKDTATIVDILERYNGARSYMKTIFFEMEPIIDALFRVPLAGQNALFIGPPGSGKSASVRFFGKCVVTDGLFFDWLCTAFTDDNELCGPRDLKKLEQGIYARVTRRKMPEAHIINLDEVYKAASVALNTLLRIINEGEYDDGETVRQVPKMALFASSNELPSTELRRSLAAFDDRLNTRLVAHRLSAPARLRMLETRQERQNPPAGMPTVSVTELATLQQVAALVPFPAPVLKKYNDLAENLISSKAIDISDRRVDQGYALLQAEALLSGESQVSEDHFEILSGSFWTTPDEIQKVKEALVQYGSPLNRMLVGLEDDATATFREKMARIGDDGVPSAQRKLAAIELNDAMLAKVGEIKQLADRFAAEGRASRKLEDVQRKIEDLHLQATRAVTTAINVGGISQRLDQIEAERRARGS